MATVAFVRCLTAQLRQVGPYQALRGKAWAASTVESAKVIKPATHPDNPPTAR
jgi:hypothetical protein